MTVGHACSSNPHRSRHCKVYTLISSIGMYCKVVCAHDDPSYSFDAVSAVCWRGRSHHPGDNVKWSSHNLDTFRSHWVCHGSLRSLLRLRIACGFSSALASILSCLSCTASRSYRNSIRLFIRGLSASLLVFRGHPVRQEPSWSRDSLHSLPKSLLFFPSNAA